MRVAGALVLLVLLALGTASAAAPLPGDSVYQLGVPLTSVQTAEIGSIADVVVARFLERPPADLDRKHAPRHLDHGRGQHARQGREADAGAVGEHHRDAGAVVPEDVALVVAAVGVHEVEPVPQVVGADVVTHVRLAGEFEVDPVAMSGDVVADDRDLSRVPEVNSVPRRRITHVRRVQRIVLHQAVRSLLQVDPEEGIIDDVVGDVAVARTHDLHGGEILREGHADVCEVEPAYGDAVRGDRHDLPLPFSIERWMTLAHFAP